MCIEELINNMGTNNQKAYFLKNLDIYSWISEQEHVRIAENSTDRTHLASEIIYWPDNDDQNIYVLKKWEIELYHVKDWKKIVFDILTPWSVFWNFEIEKPKPTHSAWCIRDSYLCITPLNEFLKIISAHPELMLKLMQKMASRIKDYEHKIEINWSSADDRVIYELKRLKEKKSKNFFWKMFDLPLNVTHEKLALITWLNRVTVTRAMDTLKKSWRIKIDGLTWAIEIFW